MGTPENTGVNKKHQIFIFEYLVFSQKSYLNMWCFEKIHICIPKIQYLHTKTWKSAYHVNFQTYFDFLSVGVTWHPKALHLYFCLVRPPPPPSISLKPVLPISLARFLHHNYFSGLKSTYCVKLKIKILSNTGKMPLRRSTESISEYCRKYFIKICLNVPCCNTCTDPNGLLCKIDTPFTNSL